MAIVTVPPFYNAPMVSTNSAAPNFTNVNTINVSGDKFAVVFQVPKSGTLDQFEIAVGTMGNNPDNGLRFSFQDISATGVPDGVQDQFRVLNPSPFVANTWYAPGLITHDGTNGGVKRTVTKGDWLCCVVEFENFVASDTLGFRAFRMANLPHQGNFYQADASSGTYAKGSISGTPLFALKYDDGSYATFAQDFVYPLSDIVTYTINSGTTPDEVAMKFTPLVDCRVGGCWFNMVASAPFEAVLYDSGSSVLATGTVSDADYDGAVTGPYTVYFPSSVTLAAGSTYRLAYKPTSGTSGTVYSFLAPGSAYMEAMPWGTTGVLSTRVNAGSWTDTTLEQLLCGILIDGLDDGAGGGGGGGTVAHTFIG